MDFSSPKKKFSAAFTAGILSFGATFAVIPTPVADASILGTIIGTGIQVAAVSQQINHFNGNGRDELFLSMQQEYGVNEDPELNARLDMLMANLTDGISRVDPSINEKPYNYFINNQTTFNAFCSLGHNISINTGLFDFIKSDDEIAVVIAHEIAHGQKNHVVKSFNKTIPVALGSAVLAESTGGIGGAVLATVLNNQITAKAITKPQEWEADNIAFDYINHTQYNPGACAAIWQRVYEKMQSDGDSNFVGEIFSPSDHPTNIQRRDNYSKKLTEMSCNHVAVADGVITLNGKNFLTCSDNAADDMSGAERSYLIAGRLAQLYENTDAEKINKEIAKKNKAKKEEHGEYKKREFSYLKGSDDAATPAVNTLPQKAWAEDGILFVDEKYILTENEGEPSAAELADIFNQIK